MIMVHDGISDSVRFCDRITTLHWFMKLLWSNTWFIIIQLRIKYQNA